MYFGLSDENSTAADEIRMQELAQNITELSGADDSDNRMAALIDKLNTVKQTIAEKRAKQSSAKQSQRRIDEILTALDALKNYPIEYDNQVVRQIFLPQLRCGGCSPEYARGLLAAYDAAPPGAY